MMKDKKYILAGLLITSLMLSACANKNQYGTSGSMQGTNEISSQTAQGTNEAASGTDIAAEGTGSGTTGEQNGAGGDTAAAGMQGAADGSNAGAVDQNSGSEGGGAASGADNSQTVSPEDTYDSQNQSGSESISGSWEGMYIADSGETLTISVTDEYTVSFAFADCGISGNAQREGAAAVFNGDDSNNIVFVLSGNSVIVNVENAEGYSAEGSPLIGTYIRQ